MRKHFVIAIALLTPGFANADACLEEFRAFYADAMDPYQRLPHRLEQSAFSEDGTLLRIFDNVFADADRTVSMARGAPTATLVIGAEMWQGPSMEGPWTSVGALPEGRSETTKRVHQENTENITDVTCHGTVAFEGQDYVSYSWTTKTNPDTNGSFFGATNTGYFDLETSQPHVILQSSMISTWAPEPSKEKHEARFTYDPTIALPTPE